MLGINLFGSRTYGDDETLLMKEKIVKSIRRNTIIELIKQNAEYAPLSLPL